MAPGVSRIGGPDRLINPAPRRLRHMEDIGFEVQNLYQELIELLATDERLVAEGQLMKNKVVELALNLDPKLIKLLLSRDSIRQHFFLNSEGVMVFDKIKFQRFVGNKEFLPDSYTAFKNKIGLTVGGDYLNTLQSVVLSWPYKDCVLEGGQERAEARRNEKFWNETLAPDQIDRLLSPKVLTAFKRYNQEGEHRVAEVSLKDNLVIRGNNLLALHTLHSVYAGKVKLIYIDPPYNTGSDDFNYNDGFNQSTWLTFMRNRLQQARNLLSDDGLLVIQIDDNQLAELKILGSEIFGCSPSGRPNFVQYIEVRANVGAANEYQNPFMPKNCEYLLIFAKNYDKRRYKPTWIKSGVDTSYSQIVLNIDEHDFDKWKVSSVKKEFERETGTPADPAAEEYYGYVSRNAHRIFQGIGPKGAGAGLVRAMQESRDSSSGWGVYRRESAEDIYTYKGRMVRFYSKNLQVDESGRQVIARELGSLWTDILWNGIAGEGGVQLKNGKKPERLLKRVIEMSTEPGEIVLDFCLGSGTTAAVAHKLGRQYIGVEQLDYEANDSVVRLQNVIAGDPTGISELVNWQGGGEFVYCELRKANALFTDRILSATASRELLELWQTMQERAFVSYQADVAAFNASEEEFKSLSFEDQKRLLVEILDKNLLYVPLSEIEDDTYAVSAEEKALNRQFFGLATV